MQTLQHALQHITCNTAMHTSTQILLWKQQEDMHLNQISTFTLYIQPHNIWSMHYPLYGWNLSYSASYWWHTYTVSPWLIPYYYIWKQQKDIYAPQPNFNIHMKHTLYMAEIWSSLHILLHTDGIIMDAVSPLLIILHILQQICNNCNVAFFTFILT